MRFSQRVRIWWYKLFLGTYPPFFFAGIRCVYIAPDYRTVRLRLPLTLLNRNHQGSLFGGSIYAMADPIHALMLRQLLGDEHVIWAKSATIDFRKPGRSTLSAEFHISEAELAAVTSALDQKGKTVQSFPVEITDRTGEIVATVSMDIYVRR